MMNRSFNVDWREVCLSANTYENNEYVLWHKRLGHFNYATLKRMGDLQMTHGLPNIQEQKSIWHKRLGHFNESILWHKRLGHFNYATLKRMGDLQMTHGLPDIQEQ
jgi:hypothetical protein